MPTGVGIHSRKTPSRRRCVAACAVFGLGALLLATVARGPAPAAGAATPRCAYAQLMAFASSGGGAFDGAGTHAYDVLLANVSHSTCTIEGFPTLTLASATRAITNVRVQKNRSGIFQAESPRLVVVRPGATASFAISYGDGYVPASDRPGSCVATQARFVLAVTDRYRQPYGVAIDIDVCRSDHRVGLTPVESGPVPRIPPST
jgi:Domain of unknown function (DUF4232)